MHHHDDDASSTPGGVPGRLRTSVIAPRRGWPAAAAGRVAHLEGGHLYLGTTRQVAGLYPWLQPGSLPLGGVPIGPDLLTREMVTVDLPGWVGHLTGNPGAWIQGQPGSGKSALVKRLCLGMVAYGYAMVVPGDVKGEYTPLVHALGGQVLRIGRGLDRVNPLDSGPLGRHLASLPAAERSRLASEVNGRRAELLAALLATSHGLGRRPAAAEATALNTAIRLAADALDQDPTVPDILRLLRDPPADLYDRLLIRDPDAYLTEIRPVVAALENLCEGPLSGLFDGPTSTPLDLDAPAVSVDLSAILTSGDSVVAAALLATWAYSYNAIDSARAFDATRAPVVLPLDELWRVLRAGPGMVAAMDAITRLNRAKGEVSLMITHSLRDLEALPDVADRAMAAGLMERCDTLLLSALPPSELARISEQRPLTDAERHLVASWAAPASTGLDGANITHAGRGKYLLKIGQRIGVPVRLHLTPEEKALYDTDAAIRGAR